MATKTIDDLSEITLPLPTQQVALSTGSLTGRATALGVTAAGQSRFLRTFAGAEFVADSYTMQATDLGKKLVWPAASRTLVLPASLNTSTTFERDAVVEVPDGGTLILSRGVGVSMWFPGSGNVASVSVAGPNTVRLWHRSAQWHVERPATTDGIDTDVAQPVGGMIYATDPSQIPNGWEIQGAYRKVDAENYEFISEFNRTFPARDYQSSDFPAGSRTLVAGDLFRVIRLPAALSTVTLVLGEILDFPASEYATGFRQGPAAFLRVMVRASQTLTLNRGVDCVMNTTSDGDVSSKSIAGFRMLTLTLWNSTEWTIEGI